MAHEVFKETELLKRERYFLVTATYSPLYHIQFNIVSLQDLRYCFCRAAQERLNARIELSKGKGLHEVVVGARGEEIHLLLSLVARGQDEYWDRYPLLADAPAYLQAVHRGKHEVEDDEIVILTMERDTRQGFLAVPYRVYRITARNQSPRKCFRELFFVFYYKNFHRQAS